MVQQADAVERLDLAIWEPGQERDFRDALFSDALPGIAGVSFLLGLPAESGGPVDVLGLPRADGRCEQSRDVR